MSTRPSADDLGAAHVCDSIVGIPRTAPIVIRDLDLDCVVTAELVPDVHDARAAAGLLRGPHAVQSPHYRVSATHLDDVIIAHGSAVQLSYWTDIYICQSPMRQYASEMN